MKLYKKTLATTLIIASTAFSIQSTASTSNTNTQTKEQPPSSKIMLAKVNDHPIYLYQLESQIQAELKKYQKLTSKKLSSELKSRARTKILQQYINAELILQDSQKHPVNNIEEKVTQYIEKAKENNLPIKDETSIKRQIHINEYLKAHDLTSPQPSEADIKAFYEQGKKQFISTEDKVHVQHIFVTKENKEQINKVKKLLENGQSFENVAKEYSEDENTKEKSGDLGFIIKGYMPKEFENIAFTIQKATLSDIIETEEGYHILKVLEAKPAGTPIPYEKMKDFLARGLASKIKEEKIKAHLKKLQNNAKIEIFNLQK